MCVGCDIHSPPINQKITTIVPFWAEGLIMSVWPKIKLCPITFIEILECVWLIED